MLNIYPINHNTNVNFKSQRDFSRIYKETKKITLTSEEKIKPKKIKPKYPFKVRFYFKIIYPIKCKIRRLWRNMKNPNIMFWTISGSLAAMMTALPILLNNCEGYNGEEKSTIGKKDISTGQYKTDSLINLYQNKTISFDEFKTSINQLHEEQ